MNLNLYNKIVEISKLPDNWNGHGADMVSPTVISRSIQLLNELPSYDVSVFPSSDDSIQFEWSVANVYYEISVYNSKYVTYIEWTDTDTEMIFVNEIELHTYIQRHMCGSIC